MAGGGRHFFTLTLFSLLICVKGERVENRERTTLYLIFMPHNVYNAL